MARSAADVEARIGGPVALPKHSLPLTRMAGVGSLAGCAAALIRLHTLVTTLPRHQPSAGEMLLSLLAVLSGISGAPAVIIGGDIFRRVTRPPRPRNLL